MIKAFVDFRISDTERINLERLGADVLIPPPFGCLYEAICGHPDILLHVVTDNTILVHRNMELDFINKLKNFNIEVLLSNKSLESNYPFDIALNAVRLNNIFLHNLKYTDDVLLELMKYKKNINTRQGYTKCSTAVVTENAVITSDANIARILKEEAVDVLFVPPGGIDLPGLDYGFIGGTCGLFNEKTIVFYGNLKNYDYGKEVLEFLKKHHVEPVYLSDGRLVDRGSILTIA